MPATCASKASPTATAKFLVGSLAPKSRLTTTSLTIMTASLAACAPEIGEPSLCSARSAAALTKVKCYHAFGDVADGPGLAIGMRFWRRRPGSAKDVPRFFLLRE